jgi:ADP-ribose pyrophosphatase YjhB (NUDIX family)
MLDHKLFNMIKSSVPLVCADIVIRNGDDVLLLQRETGRWGIPGGRVEFKEKLLDAAKRELFEETGIKTNLTYKGFVEHVRKYHEVVAIFEGRVSNRDVVLSEEHVTYKWVKLEEAHKIATVTTQVELLVDDGCYSSVVEKE